MSEMKKWFLSLNTKLKIALLLAGAVLVLTATLLLVFLLPKPEKLEISATDLTLQLNETKVLDNYSVNDNSAVITFNFDSDIIQIKNFRATGLKEGSTNLTITAHLKNETATCTCTVTILSNETNPPEKEDGEKEWDLKR